MRLDRYLSQSVRPRSEDDSHGEYDDWRNTTDDGLTISLDETALDHQNLASSNETEERSSRTGNDNDAEPSLADVSFGALAKAQELYPFNQRKRKFSKREATRADTPEEATGTRNDGPIKQPAPGRSSKHAPVVQSSRHAVPRRRLIFSPPPSLKSRDPRFDPSVTAASNHYTAADRANKNYAFLTSYQANEILKLKSQIKKAKEPEEAAELKRELMSLESHHRLAEAKIRERLLLQEHKRKESAAIREGKKNQPYFLKKSELKEAIKKDRLEAMGKRARDKADRRRQKREKGKEARAMPRVRRAKDDSE